MKRNKLYFKCSMPVLEHRGMGKGIITVIDSLVKGSRSEMGGISFMVLTTES